jgi:hypothetical protein
MHSDRDTHDRNALVWLAKHLRRFALSIWRNL